MGGDRREPEVARSFIIGVCIAVMAADLGCTEPAAPPPAPAPAVAVARPTPSPPAAPAQKRTRASVDERAATLFRTAGAHGTLLMLDVDSGAVIASVGVGRDVAAPLLPLSVMKLYLAALWWEHGMGDGHFPLPSAGPATVDDMLVRGDDLPGKQMAAQLRRAVGAAALIAELRHLGLGAPPGQLELPVDGTDDDLDASWGETLSIGEKRVTVTSGQISSLLRAIGAGGGDLVQPDTARRLQRAMLGAVVRGTARAAAPRMAGTGWQLGGKTGTGPDRVSPTSDGWFAGLVFEGGRARYTVAVFVEGHGRGGGVAASMAADVARFVAGFDG